MLGTGRRLQKSLFGSLLGDFLRARIRSGPGKYEGLATSGRPETGGRQNGSWMGKARRWLAVSTGWRSGASGRPRGNSGAPAAWTRRAPLSGFAGATARRGARKPAAK